MRHVSCYFDAIIGVWQNKRKTTNHNHLKNLLNLLKSVKAESLYRFLIGLVVIWAIFQHQKNCHSDKTILFLYLSFHGHSYDDATDIGLLLNFTTNKVTYFSKNWRNWLNFICHPLHPLNLVNLFPDHCFPTFLSSKRHLKKLSVNFSILKNNPNL